MPLDAPVSVRGKTRRNEEPENMQKGEEREAGRYVAVVRRNQ
jgi:hypothetical protein